MGSFMAVVVSVPMFAERTAIYEAIPTMEASGIETSEKPRVLDTLEVGEEVQGIITMYNSVPEQTDSTPFITASGEKTREGIVANNCLPFGSKVFIGDKTYEVQDRMNSRYSCERFDIWSSSVEKARSHGTQTKKAVVLSQPI